MFLWTEVSVYFAVGVVVLCLFGCCDLVGEVQLVVVPLAQVVMRSQRLKLSCLSTKRSG